MSDYQRDKVYEAESDAKYLCANASTIDPPNLEPDELEAFAQRALEGCLDEDQSLFFDFDDFEFANDTYDEDDEESRYVIGWVDSGEVDVIHIHPDHLSPWFVCHELTHHLVGPEHGHDRVFTTALVEMVGRAIDPLAGVILRICFQASGVDVDPAD